MKRNRVINRIISVLREEKVTTVPEILDVYATLGIWLGMSIDRKIEIDTPATVVQQLYLEKNSLGAALVIFGDVVYSWINSWKEQKKAIHVSK